MRKHRISDIVTLVLFLCVIFGFAAAFAALPDRDSNSFETGLQRLPKASAAGNKYSGFDYFLHGEMADDFDVYFCDQFPLRKPFVTLKALLETLSFRGVNNGVLYADGRLATLRFDAVGTAGNTEEYSRGHVDRTLRSLRDACEGAGVPAKVLLPPRTIDVIAPEIGCPAEISDELNAQAKAVLGGLYVDVLPMLREMDAEGKLPYFRTDHHWTAAGALAVYGEVARAFGAEPAAGVGLKTVATDFRGSSCRNGNYFFVRGEKLQIFDPDGVDGDFKVELGTSLAHMGAPPHGEGLYDFTALESRDMYNIFLHGKTKYLKITKHDSAGAGSAEAADSADSAEAADCAEAADYAKAAEKRETLLVLKDSFAHSLVPLLAQNYDIVMADIDALINPALGTEIDLPKLLSDTGADKVLVVYNLQNVIENEKLAHIK